ncbi:hypothetical protein [Pseudoalteromonas sp. T1lg48]|uniref:hypothetical protein n=1 Tax=Pseudoalteromonas sp. T1lg48 TaxID=2077100 RepID=UPI000CF7262A|nr:hypothetical protein [Pseudoalteromonas sp. T1lg48]
MLIQRVLLFVVTIGITLSAGVAGIYGGEAVAVKLFGPEILIGPYTALSPKLWVLILFFGLGALVSGFGVISLLVMPLMFMFPNHRKPFSWMKKPSKRQILVLKWYAEGLKKYTDDLERNA